MKALLIIIALVCSVSYANTQVNDTIVTDSGKVINSYLVSMDGTKEKIGSVRYKGDHEWVEIIMASDTINFFSFDSVITFHSKDCISKRTYRATNSVNVYSFELRDEYKKVHTVNLNHKTHMLNDYTNLDRSIGKAIISTYNHHLTDFESKFNSDVGAVVSYDSYTRKVFDDRTIEQYFLGADVMTVIITYTKPVADTKEPKIKLKVRDDGSVEG